MTVRPARSIVAALALLALAGCATDGGGGTKTSPEELFTAGYESLSTRYIEPVDLGVLTANGLNRLATFDPALSFVQQDGTVALYAGDRQVAHWQAPRSDDAAGWARVTSEALADARNASPVIGTSSYDSLYDTMFRGIMSSFDRYSRYAGPETARRNRAAREGFGGLGITIGRDDRGAWIEAVHPETPASRAGLRVNDRITHIDGVATAGLTRPEIVDLLRGPVGSVIELRISRKIAPRRLKVSVERALITVPTVAARREGGALILKISGFNQGTAAAVSDALSRAEREMGRRLTSVVLDLRGNPGGLLDQAVAVADLFLVDGTVISTVGRHPKSFQIFDATWGELVPDVPVVVLINGRSASAAEIVAAALRDRGRALVIGSASYGKGTVQTIVRLPNDGELTFTWARLMAPSGFALQDHGIIPAICTSGDSAQSRALIEALRRHRASSLDLIDLQLRARLSRRRHPELARAACPPQRDEPDSDIAIARLLTGDRHLYTHTLVVGRPAVARLDDDSTASRP